MHSEPGATGGAATGNATSENEASMQDTSVVPGESHGQGGVPAPAQAPTPIGYPTFHGRTVSWVAVAIMVVGFIVGGVGLVAGGHGGPIWWMFWTGAGIAVLGLLIALMTNTFEDWY